VLDSNENCVEENKNDDKPVERLTLDKMPNFYSAPDTNDLCHSNEIPFIIAKILSTLKGM